jgi:RNA polymerase sigma factor (TIGR02999 family)
MQGAPSKSKQTVDELMPSVYEELRRLARRYLVGERPGHTLRPTALVNEVYLKLAGQGTEWHDKSKFIVVASRAMRHILVDYARSQGRKKRGMRPQKITLDETATIEQVSWPDLLDLDEALDRLGELDHRKAQAIELLFFGGLTYDECAAALAISPVTLYRDLRMAKAWLNRELAPAERQE